MPQRKPGKPSISEAEAERVLAALRRLYVKRFGENKSALARALGISQPAVTQLLDGTNMPSLKTARAVARIEGVDATTYLDEHADESAADGPFPSKQRAARSARWLMLAEWAIEQMLSEPPPPGLDADPGPMFWFRRVEQLVSAPRSGPDQRGNDRSGRPGQTSRARRVPQRS